MKTYTPYDRNDLHIRKHDKVLEIGPGHNPTYRANVIVEKFIDTNYHRCGDVKVYDHQIFIHASGEKLPFEDKEFDYVICNQVLEHVEDPISFVKELSRVAKRGYIETPSLIGEFLFPKESHKWIILELKGKLVMCEKSKMPGNYKNDYGELFLNYLPYQSIPYALLWLTDGDISINRYEWKDEIDIIVNPEDEYLMSFFKEKWNRNMVQSIFPARSKSRELINILKVIFYILKTRVKHIFFNHGEPLPLYEYAKKHKIIHYQ